MVISPASLVTLSTDRWQELGEFLARRAASNSTEASATDAVPDDRKDGEEPSDVDEH